MWLWLISEAVQSHEVGLQVWLRGETWWLCLRGTLHRDELTTLLGVLRLLRSSVGHDDWMVVRVMGILE